MKETNHQKILRLLRTAGNSGVSSYDFTYVHGMKQAPTRVLELREKGYNIISKPHGKTVIYILDGQLPTYLKPQASKERTEPQKQEMTWETYKNERGEWVSREVPVIKQLSI